MQVCGVVVIIEAFVDGMKVAEHPFGYMRHRRDPVREGPSCRCTLRLGILPRLGSRGFRPCHPLSLCHHVSHRLRWPQPPPAE